MAAIHDQIAVKPGRLPILDGLRGLAAIAVMLYHIEVVFHSYGSFSRSYLFVDFFFLLSGFVLAIAAESKMNNGQGTLGFMRARIKRLWPVIAAGAVIGAAFYGPLHGWSEAMPLLLLALLMVPAIFGPGQIFPLNGPQWSLLLELLANLFHGLLLRRLNQQGLQIFVAISGLALAATIFTFGSNTLGPFAHNWYYALPRVAFAYSLGVLFGRIWQKGDHRQLLSWEIALALPLILLVILPGLPISVAIGDAAMSLLILPALFWIAATCEAPKQIYPYLDRLGALSFPLYAVHLPIVGFFGRFGDTPMLKLAAVSCALLAAQILASTLESRSKRKSAAKSVQARVPVT